MKRFAVVILLMTASVAWSQNDLPLTFQGACAGTQTDIHDLSAVQDTPAIECDSLTVLQINDRTVVSFSKGNPENPVLMFAGNLVTVYTDKSFDPYLGPISSAFPIDRVLWGDGKPAMPVQAGEHMDKLAGRGCYFHFMGDGWGQLSMVECELITDTPSHRPRRVTVTFRTERKFTIDGQLVSVKYGKQGANSFETLFKNMKIEGTCGIGLYQVGGILRHTEAGTPIEDLFKVVCYLDVANTRIVHK